MSRSRSRHSTWPSGLPAPPRQMPVAVAAADEADEVGGVAEAARRRARSVSCPAGRIAAQRHDVLDAAVDQTVDDAADLLAGRADAGEVGHRA